MSKMFLIKIGEIALKGGNKRLFEKQLRYNIKKMFPSIKVHVYNRSSRFYLETDEENTALVHETLSKVFGITGFTETTKTKKDIDAIYEAARDIVKDVIAERGGENFTFKFESRRTDKSFPMGSYEISAELGARVLDEFTGLTVNVREPDLCITVEVRENVYVYGKTERGPGGLPVKCAGRGMLLLSGGIDSPVAGYLMAKRGLKLDAIYFHTYPYTSDEAKEKVVTLAKLVAPWTIGINLFIVPFTDIQLKIKEKCATEETTLLTRACMMQVSAKLAKKRDALCLVTGESLSQVASQTVQSLHFTGSNSDLPVFRPLIGMDKEEIIKIAKNIDTFETSILPYEDCCTIFSPKHPLVRPDFNEVTESFKKLDIMDMLDDVVDKVERIFIKPGLYRAEEE